MNKKFVRLSLTALLVMMMAMALAVPALANSPVSGAAFTTVNESVDGAGHCQNGNPNVNCNIYDGKEFVWLNGGPSVAYVGDGNYFFAVLVPGGQADPNDGAAKNLSDDFDAYTNRTFSVSGGTVSYGGTHDFDSNKIRLADYADTSNPGGVYILAICSLADGYPVDPSDCKYDAFKIQAGEVVHGLPLTITKDANGAYDNTFTWDIAKDVDQTHVNIADGDSATFNYTVTVTHDGGTISNVKVTGTISVFNPNVDGQNNTVPVDIDGVTDKLSDGTVCTVTNGGPQTLTQAKTEFAYECDLTTVPQGELDNTAKVTWSQQLLDNGALLDASSANFTFTSISFAETKVNDCVDVSDSIAGALGTVCSGDPSPTEFNYSHSFDGVGGTCTDYPNTASLSTGASDSKSVEVCVGKDLSVSKTANPAFKRTFQWGITKTVDKTLVQQLSGTATFNYTVSVTHNSGTDSDWVVSGKITVSNPNNWEDIVANVADAVNNGGTCTVTGGSSVNVPKSSSVTLDYSCTYASAPSPMDGTNTGTASWDKTVSFTPSDSATGTAAVSFSTTNPTLVDNCVTVTDTLGGNLGTACNTDPSPKTFTYSKTVNVPTNDTCTTVNNTATFTTNTTRTTGSASKSVTVCGAVKGGLTIGFWQNKNGQSIITGGASTGGICNSGTWLRQYAPFQDLSSTANCNAVATYVTNIIKAANASGASMNAMLKAQMLATALDVYFSDPALGGNKISAPTALGGVKVDLTKICKMIDGSGGTGTCSGTYQNASSAFGGATSLTVSQILSYAASQSNAGGSTWYGQVKATQELAKNTFDAINNQVAFVAP